jgi:broad specificity phosphatase PhoE
MENIHLSHKLYTTHTLREGSSFPVNRYFLPVADLQKNKYYRARLEKRITVDHETGQIFMKAPGVELKVPLLVVRHGQTDGNVRRIFQGWVDGPENQLNDVGKAQAQKAAQALYQELDELLEPCLQDFALSGKLIVLHSPMSRARDTANTFLEYFRDQTGISLDPMVEEKLTEMCFGIIDGLSLEQIEDEDLKALILRYKAFQDATIDWNGTGESFLDVVARVTRLLEKLNEQYCHDEVLVIAFAHAMLINALRVAVGDKDLVGDDGLVAFRKHALGNAEAYWLGGSQKLAQQLLPLCNQKSL